MARRRHMVNRLFRGFLCGFWIISIGCFFVACATTRGGGQDAGDRIADKAKSIEATAKTGKDIVNNSHATPEEKKALNEAFDSMAKDSREIVPEAQALGKQSDINYFDAIKNASAAHKWHVLMWIIGIGSVVSIGLLWVFRASIIPGVFKKAVS